MAECGCVYLQLAMCSLIRGNELELAACVGIVLGEAANQSTEYCLELLARKYMTTPTWYVSIHASPVSVHATQTTVVQFWGHCKILLLLIFLFPTHE